MQSSYRLDRNFRSNTYETRFSSKKKKPLQKYVIQAWETWRHFGMMPEQDYNEKEMVRKLTEALPKTLSERKPIHNF